eukprot:TRINITY_DN835_c0_g1_i2.p1 TRINITY_DN835_c0_g1~~TRINITY_DN835_c0_g1_i2.p1  ORF type:complete len:632 (+),score=225.23 TRINITY_DN835_c0_g1_i2:144-2039(+)
MHCSAACLSSTLLTFTVLAQFGLSYWAFKNAGIMKRESERVLDEYEAGLDGDPEVLITHLHQFLGPVYAIVPACHANVHKAEAEVKEEEKKEAIVAAAQKKKKEAEEKKAAAVAKAKAAKEAAAQDKKAAEENKAAEAAKAKENAAKEADKKPEEKAAPKPAAKLAPKPAPKPEEARKLQAALRGLSSAEEAVALVKKLQQEQKEEKESSEAAEKAEHEAEGSREEADSEVGKAESMLKGADNLKEQQEAVKKALAAAKEMTQAGEDAGQAEVAEQESEKVEQGMVSAMGKAEDTLGGETKSEGKEEEGFELEKSEGLQMDDGDDREAEEEEAPERMPIVGSEENQGFAVSFKSFVGAFFPDALDHKKKIYIVERCGKQQSFEQATVHGRYFSMMAFSQAFFPGFPSYKQLKQARHHAREAIIIGLAMGLLTKYASKFFNFMSCCCPKHTKQTWDLSRTAWDKMLQGLLLNSLSILFTLTMQISLCTVYFVFEMHGYYVCSYLPVFGLALFLVSLISVTLLDAVDRCRGIMLRCTTRGIYCFWILYVLYMFVLCLPLLGYSFFGLCYLAEVFRKSDDVMKISPAYQEAKSHLLTTAVGFVVVAMLDVFAMLTQNSKQGQERSASVSYKSLQ